MLVFDNLVVVLNINEIQLELFQLSVGGTQTRNTQFFEHKMY